MALRSVSGKDKQIQNLFLAGTLALAFCLRWFRLGASSLWFDEIMTAGRVTERVPEILRELRHLQFPPLYYLTVKVFVKLFGFNEFSLRLPSAIASVLCVFMVYRLGKTLFGQREGLIAAFLITISAYNINYAQEAKMYAMTWLLTTASYLYFFRWLNSLRRRHLVLYALFSWLLIFTYYQGFLFLISQNIFFFFYLKAKKTNAWLKTQAVILFTYLPWAVLALPHVQDMVSGIYWIDHWPYLYFFKMLFMSCLDLKPWPWEFLLPLFQLPLLKKIQAVLYFTLFFLAFIRLGKAKKQNSFQWDLHAGELLMLSWIVIPVIGYVLIDKFSHPILVVRYLGFVHLPLFLLLAKGIGRLSPKLIPLCLAIILIFSIPLNLYPYYHDASKISYEDWREAGRFLDKEAGANSIVIAPVYPRLLLRTLRNGFAMYYRNSQEIVNDERLVGIPYGTASNKSSADYQDLTVRADRNKSYYVILHYRQEPPEWWSEYFRRVDVYYFRKLKIFKYMPL